ncbi:hypothetical protein [Streptomyces sp. NPDC059247]|uniref:hypothetical protein n=1 Tax=Streptomyces sp. NPDC059247 TaxID=3346790 RepID=UPI00368B83EC
MRLLPYPAAALPATLPGWVPRSGFPRRAVCGHDFDAVRVVAARGPALAAAVLNAGGRGPVLADPYSGSWHVFTAPGTMTLGDRWTTGSGFRLLRPGTRLRVPPANARAGPDLYWWVPPGAGSTSAAQLVTALMAATGVTSPTPRAHR